LNISAENVKTALQDFEKVRRLAEEKDFGSEFRARAEEFLNYLGISGLLPTLTFYYAKTEGKYNEIAGTLEGRNIGSDVDGRQLAYGIYLYFVLKRIVTLGFLESAQDPLNCFKKLSELDSFKLGLIFTQIIPYCEELAKICEATFKREEG
jgi:CRISPR type III-B/RAMP module-associated protein Cmr5